MNKLKFVWAFLIALALYSCIDTEERIEIRSDDSGTYKLTLDMGKLLELASQMMPDTSKAGKPKEKKDSTIYFKTFIDTASNLTAQEKELYKNGYLHIDMDEASNKLKIEMGCPFKNSAQLTLVKNNFLKVANKLNVFDKTKGAGMNELADNPTGSEKGLDDKSINPLTGNAVFTAAPGKISNTITLTDDMRKSIANDSTLAMMQQMSMMTGDLTYRTVIVLPRAPKIAEGPGKHIEVDGKTVSFSFTLTDMMDKPEKGSYTIEN